jgi:hypothetical protein
MDEMSTTMDFEEELEVFRTEEEVAQQYFFAYLSVCSLAASSKDVLANMNTTPLFWRTTHHAMLVAAFLALGRIFDQDPKSDHNIDKLMRAASAAQAQGLFSKAALAQRKTGIGLSAQQIADYVDDTQFAYSTCLSGHAAICDRWRRLSPDRASARCACRRAWCIRKPAICAEIATNRFRRHRCEESRYRA